MIKSSKAFNDEWDWYQAVIDKNVLFHKEMFNQLDQFITENFAEQLITIVDLGCGNGTPVLPVLSHHKIKKYIGIDAAPNLIAEATQKLERLDCEKQFIISDLLVGMNKLYEPIDIIFSSYAVHHLTLAQKKSLLKSCYDKLTQSGYLLLVDVILRDGETIEQFLSCMRQRLIERFPDMSDEQIDKIMQHPTDYDIPETITTYQAIAGEQNWSDCQVLVNKETHAFIMFTKS